MSKWRSAWRTALYDARLIIFSSRFAMLSVVAFIFMDLMMRPIRDFAGIYNLKVVPAVLPFYLTNTTFGNLAFLLLILLFSDTEVSPAAGKEPRLGRHGACAGPVAGRGGLYAGTAPVLGPDGAAGHTVWRLGEGLGQRGVVPGK